MEAATAEQEAPSRHAVSSFAKGLFLGEIHEDMVFPFPRPDEAEQAKVRQLIDTLREFANEAIDPKQIEEDGWVGDDVIAGLGERGFCGLYVPDQYGGQGLSQTGYCRVFETVAQVDPTLAVVLGVHQSIGYKGIALFGTDAQKERFLPDLAAGRKLAAYALTEPNAGSDAYHIESRATRQSDGSWKLNGVKRFIGNGGKASIYTTFARCEIDGKDRHIALLVERGMDGFEVGRRYGTMGLRGNDLRELHFNDVRVPAENVLGEPGEGFKLATEVLNNGRLSLATGAVGGAKWMADLIFEHINERRQFDRKLAEFELVKDKVGWLVSNLFGLESMCYLTTGIVDAGVPDYSIESAICKVAATEFVWYGANRALQLKGGAGYLTEEPYEKVLRDIRIFPIFEGANDVLRAFIALTGIKPLGDKLEELGDLDLSRPIQSLGVLAEYVGERVAREVRPDRITKVHPELAPLAEPISGQVKDLRGACESLLREHKKDVLFRQFQQKRIAAAVSDIYAQIAMLSRLSQIFEEHGPDEKSNERYIAETFCRRAAARVESELGHIEDNDDERMIAIADRANERRAYGYALFED
jgi:acyl-CoA dehydrogenase family protein 9